MPDLDRDGAKSRGTQRRLEPAGGNAAGEAPQRLVLFHADHRIVVAGHADVGDESCAAGRGCDGRRSAHGCGCRRRGWPSRRRKNQAPIFRCSPRHARRSTTASQASPSGEAASSRSSAAKGSSSASMKIRPSRLTTRSRAPLAFSTIAAPRPGVPGGIVGRTDQARLPVDEHERLALVEGVIAKRHRIDADGQEFLEDRLRDAKSAGGVLPVDDDEIEAPARAQERNLFERSPHVRSVRRRRR